MKYRKLLLPLCIVLFTIFAYRNSFNQFFLQDEWLSSGVFLYYEKIGLLWRMFLPFKGLLAHFNPLNTLFFLGERHYFQFHYEYYALMSILTHAINGVILSFFVYRLTKKWIIAFPVAFLFVVNSIPREAITWIAGGNGLLQTTTLFLLSLHFLYSYIQTRDRRFLLLTMTAFFLSLFFKEDLVFLFIGIPSFYLILEKRSKRSLMRTILLALIATAVIFLGIRLFLVSMGLYAYEEVVDVSTANMFVYPFRIITMPLRMLTQSFVPESFVLSAARFITHLGYPQFVTKGEANPFISETIVADLILYIGAVVFFSIAVKICKILWQRKEKNLLKLAIFSIVLIVESAVSYVFVPGRAGFFSIFPSRYLYISSIGASIFLVLMVFAMWTSIKKFSRRVLWFGYGAGIGFIVIFHFVRLQQAISNLSEVGTLRKSLLTTMSTRYPVLPQKVIIFSESNRAYYGSPPDEHTLPVQSGFGQMLLVWYDATENFPACLFEKLYLYERLSQGYRECDGRGFGYFREKDKLMETVNKFDLPPESVIGFSYSARTQAFEDITDEIRKEIDL